jgi:hypothetical protein
LPLIASIRAEHKKGGKILRADFVKHKKKAKGSTIVIAALLLSLAMLSTPLVGAVSTSKATSNSANSTNQSSQITPLTNVEIAQLYPNLPTASQLWNSNSCVFVDLNTSSQPQSNLATFGNATLSPINISNYTSDTYDYFNGHISENVPTIWLKYTENIWVLVPLTYLTNTSTATPASTPQTTTTWAEGVYTNPAQIAGTNTVSGALSFGCWGSWNPSSSSYYLGDDVLTVFDGAFYMQWVEQQTKSGGYQMVQEIIYANGTNYGTNTFNVSPTPTLGTKYPIDIQSVSGNWSFYFNGVACPVGFHDGITSLVTGNQTNIAVETNDFTQSDFPTNGVSFGMGLMQVYTGLIDPAIGYYYSGAWYPQSIHNPLPAAYVYYGGSVTNVIFGVGNTAPPSWFGEMGYSNYKGTQPNPETLVLGNGVPQYSYGALMWP